MAWKTGTSYGGRDAWAIGTTPRYTVGVWVGNASGEGRPGLTGVGNAAPVLFDLFSLLPGSGWFDMPYDELLPMAICRLSGHKASAICDQVDTLYMPRSADKTEVCPYHRLVHLSADGRFRVNSSCESVGRMIARPWFVLPPSEEYYYRNYHIDYAPLPPVKPGCGEDRGRQIELIYRSITPSFIFRKASPANGSSLSSKLPTPVRIAILYWHLDDTYAGETTDHHQISFSASPRQTSPDADRRPGQSKDNIVRGEIIKTVSKKALSVKFLLPLAVASEIVSVTLVFKYNKLWRR
ncbi:MAG: hypothetical protein ACLR6J_18475 [Parabacteroides merdae]